MSPVDATLYASLPPTYNTLEAADRIRLMRTTRKLNQLLGTMPSFAESTALPITLLPIGPASDADADWRKHRRYGSVFASPAPFVDSVDSFASASSASSCSSFVSITPDPSDASDSDGSRPSSRASKKSQRPRPRPILLRVNHATPILDMDVFSPVSPLPPTPRSPASPVAPKSADVRRRRFDKLTRHLGENVPPELVFPATPAPKSAFPTSPAPRSARAPRTPLSPLTFSPSAHAPTTPQTMPLRTHAPRPSVDLNALAFTYETGKRRSMSISEPSGRCTPVSAAYAHTHANARAEGRDWVGEWNRGDIREVQQRLRTLKAR